MLQADDARFLTGFGSFRLRGSVTLQGHHEVPAAVEEYAGNVHRVATSYAQAEAPISGERQRPANWRVS